MVPNDFSIDSAISKTDLSSVDTAKKVLPNIITKLEFEPSLVEDGIDENGDGWEEF